MLFSLFEKKRMKTALSRSLENLEALCKEQQIIDVGKK